MNLDHLASQIATARAGGTGPSHDCPDEHQIAGYVDGRLDGAARAQVETHLADCRHCLELVGLLAQERDVEADEPVSELVVARARALAQERAPTRWRLAPQWAAAAALVLAVPLLLQLGRNAERGLEGQGRPEAPATRTAAPPAAGLQVLSPGAGTVVDARRLTFRWTEVPGSPYYDVRIVTDGGDVLVQERVTGTAWRPSARLSLRPGADYFVHVDAYPAGDKSVSSDHVPFRVAE
jgi:hypothetical protein